MQPNRFDPTDDSHYSEPRYRRPHPYTAPRPRSSLTPKGKPKFNAPVYITGTLERMTPSGAAMVIKGASGRELCLPKSQCTEERPGRFRIPLWLAKKEGLV